MNWQKSNLIALAVASGIACAASSAQIEVSRRNSGEAVAAPAENFTGTVKLESQFHREAPSRLSGAVVTFEPGARTNWHTHPVGQTLIVTAGIGHVQSWGEDRKTLHEGDIVWIPPNVKHWHGAAANSSLTHVAFVETLDGKSVDWLEAVTDRQYASR
jgi:quercetin dioxygenase-like cupin family protein